MGNRGGGLRRVADYNEINVNARDRASGQTFVETFRLARRNLDCNRGAGMGATRRACGTGSGC